MNIDNVIITPSYQRCFDFIDGGLPVTFVSGQAGSGKTVLIEYIRHKYRDKRICVAAPTGIAALNAKGQTCHSLFSFRNGIITKQAIMGVLASIYRRNKEEIFTNMDILIIDEIPMVRADIIDGIDMVLRTIRKYDYPFGGVQVLLIGDMFQLPPIVAQHEEDIFNKMYDTPYFFSSKAFDDSLKYNMIDTVMLTGSFRQKDNTFVDILNDIRVGANIYDRLMQLNQSCFYGKTPWNDTERLNSINICCHNKVAASINDQQLHKLPGKMHTFQATITGDFDMKSVITPEVLQLKVNSKVMFTRNGQEWVNGTIGFVEDFLEEDNSIIVYIPANGITVAVKRETWENMEYVFNEESKSMQEIVKGTFNQFPLILADAVTVHKSQGLTFDQVKLNVGNGAFATGQTYVGLSRCTTLPGIHLATPLTQRDILVDQRIVDFYKCIE